jgi:hypothetical protein
MLPAIRLGPHFHPHLSSDSCVKVLLRVKYVMWGGEKSFFQKDLWIAPRLGSLRIFSKTIVCPFQQVVYSRDISAVLGGRDSFSNLTETTWLLPQRYLLLRRHNCKPSCLLTPHPPTFRVRCRFRCQLGLFSRATAKLKSAITRFMFLSISRFSGFMSPCTNPLLCNWLMPRNNYR